MIPKRVTHNSEMVGLNRRKFCGVDGRDQCNIVAVGTNYGRPIAVVEKSRLASHVRYFDLLSVALPQNTDTEEGSTLANT